jgi:erythritol kinase
MAVIAVDAGTTMIKAVGYDEEGTEMVVVRQATSVSRPQPGWAEQDMLAVWDAVVFSVRSVQRQLKSDIDFLAITAQGCPTPYSPGCSRTTPKGLTAPTRPSPAVAGSSPG